MEITRTDTIEYNTNSISLAGEFAVLSQLALRGFDASMTLGHTKGVDILISDPKTGKMFKMEVKTHHGSKPTTSKLFGHCLEWVMSEKHEGINDPQLFYCFVYIELPISTFRFFIVPSAVVAKYVREQHQHYTAERNIEETDMRKFRVGLEESGYTIDTPLAKDFEDNWDISQS
ncbi:MAG: hypothetical protein WC243_03615 [Patescibacteria group bacterium]|jgi:hypothetical protein